jgi:hypothetical protein
LTNHPKFIGATPAVGILCHLCRRSTALTKAHIPPRCAGNRGHRVVRMRPTVDSEVLGYSRPLEGGLWLRTLCEPCNGLASAYDDDYGDLAAAVARFDRLTTKAVLLPHSAGVPAVSVSPGRVARSLLYGMVALAPAMNLVHSAFLDDLLRDDDDLQLPAGLRLRVARVPHRACRVSSAYSMQQVAVRRQIYDVFAEICFPPFVWALCGPVPASLGPNLIDVEQWGDATDWVRYSRAATRRDLRDVLDHLPVTVHPTQRNRDHWVDLYSAEASYVLEGMIKR